MRFILGAMDYPIGIIDIGSNSVRLVVYDPPYIGQVPYFNEKVQCGLGRNIGKTGRLDENGRKAALDSLKGFKTLADAMGLETLHTVGTAALRDAEDGPEFIQEVLSETGIVINILDGNEEARLAALGVIQNFKNPKGIVGDLGGGSLELGLIQKKKVTDSFSMKLGVLRVLSEDNPSEYIDKILETLPGAMKGHKNFYTVGGTWRAMAHIYYKLKGHPYDRLMGKRIPADAMIAFTTMISAMPPEELMRDFNVEDRRSELMPTAATLLNRLLKALDTKTVIISTSGLRDGLLHQILEEKAA